MPVINGRRMPCERCGQRLYFHEQRERWCRPCAMVLDVSRLCDGLVVRINRRRKRAAQKR